MTRKEAKPCPLCGAQPLSVSRLPGRDAFDIECRRCGRFTVSGTLYATSRIPDGLKARLRAYTRQCQEEGEYPQALNSSNIHALAEGKRGIPVSRKPDELLAVLVRRSRHPGAPVIFSEEWDYPLIDAESPEEARFYLLELRKRKHVVPFELGSQGYVTPSATGTVTVTHEGWNYFQKTARSPSTAMLAEHTEMSDQEGYDAFVCHASEDKATVVEPLVTALDARGVRVWYDRTALTIGDSLRRKIDEGLAQSRYGIVVLSLAFFGKGWPQRELDGLVQKEIGGQKAILPIWHEVTHAEVARYSLPLADRVAGSTKQGIDALAGELVRAMRPGMSASRPDSGASPPREIQGPIKASREEMSREEIERILPHFSSPNVDVRRDTVREFLNLSYRKRAPQGVELLNALDRLLSDADVEVRLGTLRILGEMLRAGAPHDKAALTNRYCPIILKLAHDDPNSPVRAQVMVTIGQSGSSQFIPHALEWIRAWNEVVYRNVNPRIVLVQLAHSGLGTQVRDALRHALETETSDIAKGRLRDCLQEVSSILD